MTRWPGSWLTSTLAVLGRQPPACSSELRYGPPSVIAKKRTQGFQVINPQPDGNLIEAGTSVLE